MDSKDAEIRDALKRTLFALERNILNAENNLKNMQAKHDGIKAALSIYEAEDVAAAEQIVGLTSPSPIIASVRTKNVLKYADSTMWEAVKDILGSQPDIYFTARAIHNELIKGGKVIRSDDTQQNVNIALYKFEKKKYIKSTKIGGRKTYQLMEK